MSIYFGFSDERGCFENNMSAKSIKTHPHYIRSTLLMNADEWKFFNDSFMDLKIKFNIPKNKEIKWAYLWQLKYHQINNKEVPTHYDIKFLENIEYQTLFDFTENCLILFNNLKYKKIIISHSDNLRCTYFTETRMLKMHLQEHIQRVEMEIQSKKNDNLAVLFFDPVSSKTDKLLRNIYFELYNSGDFIAKYKHIKDSLNIEHSHQSVGIQVADFISGAFSSFLKGIDNKKHENGKRLFYKYLHPNLRTYKDTIWGAGIREVPSSPIYRNKLEQEMNKEINSFH